MLQFFFSFLSVALCGSEAQKQKYLPSLSQFKTVGCWVSYIVQFIFNHLLLYCQHHHSSLQYCGCYLIFHLPERTVSFLQALTEPDYGSDASSLRTAATKVYFIWKHDIFFLKINLDISIDEMWPFDANHVGFFFWKVPGGWHLDGQKRWIGNSTFADVLIILARNADTNQLNG